jgi:electron-transferring-flavoprotein dehydrogenase
MSEIEREGMEFDVVDRRRRPCRSRDGHPPAIQLKQSTQEVSVVVLEKGSEVGAHILSGAVIDPIGLDTLLPDWKLEKARTRSRRRSRTIASSISGLRAELRLPNIGDAAADEQSRQLHRQPRQCLPLAGRAMPRRSASRSIRASPPPKCSTTRKARVDRRRDRRHGRRARWISTTATSRAAWRCSASMQSSARVCAVRWPSNSSRKLRPRGDREPQKYGIGLKELWQVEAREAQAGPRATLARLAAGQTRRVAARSSITTAKTIVAVGFVDPSQLSRTRICRPSRNSSVSRRIRRSATRSRAPSAFPTAHAPSPKAGSSRCRSCPSPAAR